MSNTSYLSGNTVRLECTFYDFDNQVKDPDLVKLKLYDYEYKLIEEYTSVEKDGVGRYYFDYMTPDGNKRIYYEWYGEYEGTPSLNRGSFVTKFM